MSTYDDILQAKTTLGPVQEAASALDDYSTMVTDLAAAGNDLSQIQNVFKGAKLFGQLSTCFAMANIGLDLAMLAFGDAPDPNAMILKAIESLDNKVTGMWAAMDLQFEKIHQHIDSNSAKAETERALTYFASLRHRIGLMREESSPSLMRDLLDERYDPADIGEQFFIVYHNVTSTDSSKNPLKAVFEESRGDAQKIVQLARPLMQLTLFAPMAYTFAAAIRHQNDSSIPLSTPRDVERLFQEHINEIIDTCEYYVKQCKDDGAAIDVNVGKTMDEIFMQGLPSGRDGVFRYYHAARQLSNMLKRKWNWFDWLVIVGEGDHGRIWSGATDLGYEKRAEVPITMRRENATVIAAWSPSNLVVNGWQLKFQYIADAEHNFSAHWTNPNRIYFHTWMGNEPGLPEDDIRRSLRLPHGHLLDNPEGNHWLSLC